MGLLHMCRRSSVSSLHWATWVNTHVNTRQHHHRQTQRLRIRPHTGHKKMCLPMHMYQHSIRRRYDRVLHLQTSNNPLVDSSIGYKRKRRTPLCVGPDKPIPPRPATSTDTPDALRRLHNRLKEREERPRLRLKYYHMSPSPFRRITS